MRIRQATAKDIIPMARLMMDVYSKPPFNARRPLSEAVKSLRYYLKMGHAFVAEERKELVGATVLRVDRFWEGNVLIIEDLAVKETPGSQNVRKALLSSMRKYAKQKKAHLISFSTLLKSPNLGFYEKNGFKLRKDLGIFEKRI